MTDGDFFGVTDYTGAGVGSYPDGTQGYQMSDTDGIGHLTFDSVTGADSVSFDMFVRSTGWETSDAIVASWISSSGNVTLLDTTGIDIDTLSYEGVWTTISSAVSGDGYLTISLESNSGSEAIFIDNVVIHSDGLDVDMDDDNDGYDDSVDDCPLDAAEHVDTDGDGYCDIQDTDDDNDGVFDWNDLFPLNGNESADADGDGIGDNADPDDDNDGVDDVNDAFPNDPTEWSDYDGDFIGDNADLDDDNDGVPDDVDVWPLDNSMSTDSDGDRISDFLNTLTSEES